jgi:hypothetical protein
MAIEAYEDEVFDEDIHDDNGPSGYVDSNYPGSYSGPRLVNHGGLCCGIKTIHSLCYGPNWKASPLEAVPKNDRAKNGYNVWSSLRYFTDSAPAETYGERVERYIKFVEKYAPKHLIEITLESSQYNGTNYGWNDAGKYPGWKKFLKKHGFKKVSEFVNSNSGNTVLVFHKLIGQPKKTKAVKDPFAG